MMNTKDVGVRRPGVPTQRFQNAGPLVGLIAMAMLCAACATPHAAGVDADDDELLRTLANLARQGTDALCDPKLLEQELAIRIGKLDSYTGPNVIKSERTETISPVSGTPAFSRAMYWKFHSKERSSCSLEIRFSDRRLCDMDSERVQRILRSAVEYGPPVPGGTARGYGYAFKPNSGSDSGLAFGLSDRPCANGFEISAEGDWK